MPDSVQMPRGQALRLDTDFGYDALGGVTGRLGQHRVEVLETGVRQTDRIPGPPKSVGRWFARLLDRLTPSGWRAQGKFRRGLEDFSAQVGRVLGELCNAARKDVSGSEREAALNAAFKELSGLRRTAAPLTGQGTVYTELLQARVGRNLAILRTENRPLLQALLQTVTDGLLDEALARLDPVSQGDMAEDLTRIRDMLHAEEWLAAQTERTGSGHGDVQAADHSREASEKTEADPLYRSRFSLASLRAFFERKITFGEHAQQALQERQATLNRFSGEARQALQEGLEAVDDILNGSAAADAEQISRSQARVEEKIKQAIHCAVNEVGVLAVRHMDRRGTVGQEGRDFQYADAASVRRELNEIERAIRTGEGVNLETKMTGRAEEAVEDPFRKGLQEARRQIQELSLLYGELMEGLGEIERRNSRARNCLLIQELLEQCEPPDFISRQEFGETCDMFIEALHAPVPGNYAILTRLSTFNGWIACSALPPALRERFAEALPELQRNMAPDTNWRAFLLGESDAAGEKFAGLEQARALHQVMGHVGALLQRTKFPQADSLISRGLHLSRLVLHLRSAWNMGQAQREQAIRELRSSVSRCMANVALARMQAVNPTVRSAQPDAGKLDSEAVLEGLTLFQRSVGLLADGLSEEEGRVVVRAAVNDGVRLVEKAEAAAIACGRLLTNVMHKEKDVAEQLAVCVESGLDGAEATLQAMLTGSRWESGKHGAARAAVGEFLEALGPVRRSREQSALLQSVAGKFQNIIVPHDAYMGFDGSLHLLINTDRQSLTGSSRSVQGTRWITLPSPEKLKQRGVSTGVNRLDALLEIEENRTEFYPQFYASLEEYFSGSRYGLPS